MKDCNEAGHDQGACGNASCGKGEEVDLIARGLTHGDSKKLIEQCALEAGMDTADWDSPAAWNICHRIANAAHKAGFNLALERVPTEAAIRKKIAQELRSSAFLHCDVNKEHVILCIESGKTLIETLGPQAVATVSQLAADAGKE